MARPPSAVLFLCTGNYYRSRFAEVVFNSVATKMGLPWRATSRALALERGANNKGPMAKEAVDLLAKMNVRDPAAVTRPPAAVTATDLTAAAKVVALLESEHRPLLAERHAGWEEKVEYWQVQDAPGVLPQIEAQVMGLVSRLLGGTGTAAEPPPTARPSSPPAKKKLGVARVGRETAGRRGKGVTTVFDLGLGEAALKELATRLKTLCGTGGTAKDGRIEIQGDHRDRIAAELTAMGYTVKRSGG